MSGPKAVHRITHGGDIIEHIPVLTVTYRENSCMALLMTSVFTINEHPNTDCGKTQELCIQESPDKKSTAILFECVY